MSIEKKIYGCLAGAAVGEAMGAVTSTWTTDLILEEYHDYVTTLRKPPVSTETEGLSKPGQVTGGFSFAYLMIDKIIKNDGVITQTDAQEAVLEWAKNPDYYRFARISSKDAVDMFGNSNAGYRYPYLTFDHHKATNESAARAVAVAVFIPGNTEMAIEQTVLAYKNVFNNTVGLAGAGAVSAAISAALAEDASYHEVLEAAVYGAKRGLDVAESYRVQPAACASVQRRAELAVSIGLKYGGDFAKAMKELEECVGTGDFANESVATAIGCIAACKGDVGESLKMAVNIGNETDAMATIVGAIVGALHPDDIRREDIATVESANGFDFAPLSRKIAELDRMNSRYYI